jgi:hypothetical protein
MTDVDSRRKVTRLVEGAGRYQGESQTQKRASGQSGNAAPGIAAGAVQPAPRTRLCKAANELSRSREEQILQIAAT